MHFVLRHEGSVQAVKVVRLCCQFLDLTKVHLTVDVCLPLAFNTPKCRRLQPHVYRLREYLIRLVT